MRVSIIQIGNSMGIRIPKPLLEQCRLGRTAELEVEGDRLVIYRSTKKVRAGWEASFQRMAKLGDDVLIDKDAWPGTRWDQEEWEW